VIEKRVIAQIFAIMLDQVEDIEDRGTGGRPSAPLVEARQAFELQSRLPAITAAASVNDGRPIQSSLRVYDNLAFDLAVEEPSGLLRTFVSWGISEHAMVLGCQFEPCRSWTRQNLRSEWIWVVAVPWGPVRFACSKRLRRPGRFHRQAERLACPTGVPGCWSTT
jgi:hypothetical protein